MALSWETKMNFDKSAGDKLAALSYEANEAPGGLCELVMPMPELLRNINDNGKRSHEVGYRAWYGGAFTDQWRPLTPTEQTELDRIGHSNWYDWSIANWGTKWGTFDHRFIAPRTLAFLSAHAAPAPEIFRRVGERVGAAFTVYGRREDKEPYTRLRRLDRRQDVFATDGRKGK
jgi:hypothetical protein